MTSPDTSAMKAPPPRSAAGGSLAIALACLAATGALLGLSTNLAKLAAQSGLPALPFLLWSVAGAGALLTIRAALVNHLPSLDGATVRYLFVAGFVSVAAPNLILFSAVPHVGAGFAALSLAFPPLLTYLGALVLRLERFDIARAAGVGLALAGALVLAVLKFRAPDAATGWVLAVLVVPVFLAIGNIYRTIAWPPGAQPDQLAPGMLLASAALLLVAGPVTGMGVTDGLAGVNRTAWLLVALQAGAFALQYLLFFVLQKHGGPVLLSLLGSVAALIGVPISVVLLGEAWPPGLPVATGLIGTGLFLLTRRR